MQESVRTIQHSKIGYSVNELAKLVGICERKIWEEIKKKNLRAARIGKRVIVRAEAVDAWLSEAEESAKAEK